MTWQAKPVECEDFRSELRRVDSRSFEGFAFDAADLSKRFVVEVLIDGWPVKLLHAEILRPDLLRSGFGDGCYGFAFSLNPASLEGKQCVTARIANTTRPVADPIILQHGSAKFTTPAIVGEVAWMGGLHLSGWIRARENCEGNVTVRALVAGEAVAESWCNHWGQVRDQNGEPTLVQRFDLYLPERFADGNCHIVRLITSSGEELSRSPLALLAFEDGLAGFLQRGSRSPADKVLAELIERVHLSSAPFSHYQKWKEQFSPSVPSLGTPRPIAVMLVGNGDAQASLESLEQQSYPNWFAALLPDRSQIGFSAHDLGEILATEGRDSDVVVFAMSGTSFTQTAIARLAHALAHHPGAVVAYPDVEVSAPDETRWPIFFPAFDYERLLEQGYCAHLFATRRAQADEFAIRGFSNLYQAFYGLVDAPRRDEVLHVPGPAALLPPLDTVELTGKLAEATDAALMRRELPAKIQSSPGALFPAICVSRAAANVANVSVVIPTRDRVTLLKACVESILAASTARIREILIVDNDSQDPVTREYLARLEGNGVVVLRQQGQFNYACLNNAAVTQASGDYVCLLNNDIEVITPDWLDEMLGRIVEPDVGAVGALLVWPTGVVQHGGVVLGPKFAPTHAFNDRMHDDPGYSELLRVAHECSAVTAACLLTRRADFLELGGLDGASFPVNYNDIDYCLRLRAKGKRIVFTPHARLVHHEAISRGSEDTASRAARFQRELGSLRTRWHAAVANDPFYSPALALNALPYSGLAWPPRSLAPRTVQTPIPMESPVGF